jgi:hypothetical protein
MQASPPPAFFLRRLCSILRFFFIETKSKINQIKMDFVKEKEMGNF